jgi:hypothetical protein
MGVSRPFRDDLGCFELHPDGVSESLGALATGITACFGDLVWPGPDGQPMPAQTLFSRRWLPMRKGARIRAVSFHALRHTAATLALEDGQPPHVVAAMLGHASVATTLRLYAHVTHASTEALVDAIDARYGPRLRVLSKEVLAQYWSRKVEIGSTATETGCRERESNAPKLPQNDRKKRRPNSRERPGSAT